MNYYKLLIASTCNTVLAIASIFTGLAWWASHHQRHRRHHRIVIVVFFAKLFAVETIVGECKNETWESISRDKKFFTQVEEQLEGEKQT